MSIDTPRLIRLPELEKRVGLKKSTVYEKIAVGEFPRQVSLGGKAVAWVESEVIAWINSRIQQRDDVPA